MSQKLWINDKLHVVDDEVWDYVDKLEQDTKSVVEARKEIWYWLTCPCYHVSSRQPRPDSRFICRACMRDLIAEIKDGGKPQI